MKKVMYKMTYGFFMKMLGLRGGFQLKDRSGFTLVELSIVIVIIGLLIGGILIGRELITAAKLRSLMSQVDSYQVMIGLFKNRFGCMPGDCNKAETFFGSQVGCPFSTVASTKNSPKTCNGNGDGIIWNSTTPITYANSQEKLRFWQHLSAANFIKEDLSGIGYTGAGQHIVWASTKVGYNSPTTKLSKDATISFYDPGNFEDNSNLYPQTAQNGNSFVIGTEKDCTPTSCAVGLYSGIQAIGAAMPAVDALSIDKKYDDGLPGLGDITAPSAVSWTAGSSSCSTGSRTDFAISKYSKNGIGEGCALFIKYKY